MMDVVDPVTLSDASSSQLSEREHLGTLLFSGLIVSCFLPYLYKPAGIRVENALGAILAIWACAVVLYRGRIDRSLWPVLGLSVALLLYLPFATELSDLGFSNTKRALGRFEHYYRGFSILVIGSAAFASASRATIERAFVRCSKILLVLLCANAVIQVLTVFLNVEPWLMPFRPQPGEGGFYVAASAASMSRFVGIFNQPVEQGTATAVALLVWVTLWQARAMTGRFAIVTLAGVFIGGMLGLSKVFLLAGVPMALLLMWGKGLRWRDLKLLVAGSVVVGGAVVLIAAYWKGAESIGPLLAAVTDPATAIYALSGGRFASGALASSTNSGLLGPTAQVLSKSPFFGFGLGGEGARDNEYLMALYEGGIFLLVMLVARLLLLALTAAFNLGKSFYSAPLLALVVLVIGGSMGAPISGIPRSGTIVWVFITLLLLLQSADNNVPDVAG